MFRFSEHLKQAGKDGWLRIGPKQKPFTAENPSPRSNIESSVEEYINTANSACIELLTLKGRGNN